MKKRGLIERLNHGPVICAEGFLFEIEKTLEDLSLLKKEDLVNIEFDPISRYINKDYEK